MNQKLVRYIGLFSLILAFSVLATGNAKIEIASANEDIQVGINNNSVSENQQDSIPPVIIGTNPVSEATQDSGTGINVNPVTEDTQDGGIGINVNPVTEETQEGNGNGTDGGDLPAVTPTPVITSSGGGSFSSGGGSGGSVLLAQNVPSGVTTIFTCPLITSFMKFGADNNSVEVAKLQAFLKNTQEIDVDVTGVYDEKTENAVRIFQTTYLADVMGPWGASQSSGMVYITTLKKVNEIACKKSIILTVSDLAIIDVYKQAHALDSTSGINGGVDLSGENIIGTATSGPELGAVNANNSANTAAVGNLSIFQRFWNFLKSLFR